MVLALLVFACCSRISLAADITTKYDDQIKQAVDTYWPDYPVPIAYKAQLYQESRLDPNAKSPVGAVGIAQFMPATWQDVLAQLHFGVADRHEAKIAIQAGAYYMAQQRRFKPWRSWADPDKHYMAQGSYNAGAGNIMKAQRLCNATNWAETIKCLPDITGDNARETIAYIDRINHWMELMQ